ncbi:MAG: hypothetical protein HQL50_05800 [Magnetococcales bacterium]|nr:hypothetical protein [Magnetococcales bacterium]
MNALLSFYRQGGVLLSFPVSSSSLKQRSLLSIGMALLFSPETAMNSRFQEAFIDAERAAEMRNTNNSH